MEHKIVSLDSIKKIVFGGKSTFTVQNINTGNRLTYRVTTLKGDKRGEIWFISVLSGNNNEADYSFVGIVFKEKTTFRLTKKSRVNAESKSFRGFSWLFNQISANKELPQNVNFYHSGRCARCGKLLTTPESIEAGFGPECIKKI